MQLSTAAFTWSAKASTSWTTLGLAPSRGRRRRLYEDDREPKRPKVIVARPVRVKFVIFVNCRLGNVDLDSMPGVVHVALEVPELSNVLWLCLPGCVPPSYDHLAVARRKG